MLWCGRWAGEGARDDVCVRRLWCGWGVYGECWAHRQRTQYQYRQRNQQQGTVVEKKEERTSDAAMQQRIRKQQAGRQAGKGTAERAELDTAVGIALLHRR